MIKKKIPCAEECPVDAIDKTDLGYSVINPDKCIHCGRCIIRCPFNAIMMPSMVVDVANHLYRGARVYAMCAPAVMVQFNGTVNQLYNACIELGFCDMMEASLGADTTSITEAAEFLEHVGGGKQALMTTSCCPAFVRAVKQHIPKLSPFVSNTKSPMAYTGDLVRAYDRAIHRMAAGPGQMRIGMGMAMGMGSGDRKSVV